MRKVAGKIEQQQKAFTTLLTSSMPINILLGLSLKTLWGMVNTLQFVIFMDDWDVNWPPNASFALRSVRTIALGDSSTRTNSNASSWTSTR